MIIIIAIIIIIIIIIGIITMIDIVCPINDKYRSRDPASPYFTWSSQEAKPRISKSVLLKLPLKNPRS